MKKSGSNAKELSSPWVQAGFLLVFSWLLSGLSLQSVCEQSGLAGAFISPASWQWGVIHLFGGEISRDSAGNMIVVTSFIRCLLAVGFVQAGLIAIAGVLLKFRVEKLAAFVNRIAKWWLLFGCWGILWLIALINQSVLFEQLLQATVVFWVSVTIAGSVYELASLTVSDTRLKPARKAEISCAIQRVNPSWKQHLPVFALLGVFAICFTAMNWGLWFNLRLPHGDSAMYEEHLWNITHGKGFRSYLDQGLFWGEHIQFVHLFLLPLHWLWPSHLLLEFCESFALALGAIPVYWMTFRSSQSQKTAVLISAAYLLYFPLQFLDISIDLKTFRPISFGVPIVLFAVDQLERKRFLTASALLIFSLSCKEDFAIIVFSIGFAMLARSGWELIGNRRRLKNEASKNSPSDSVNRRELIYGAAFLLLGPAYLLFAMNLIRSFRSGVEVHYAGYFSKFGKSTSEIIWNMLTDPGLLIGELLTVNALVYALALLVPLGFLPLCSGWRGLSCVPMFVLLCLNELSQIPVHHFHAPLIPLIFWTLAAGISTSASPLKFLAEIRAKGKTDSPTEDSLSPEEFQNRIERRGLWVASSALATSIWFTLTPLGVPFWDTGSNWNGATLYIPDERAEMFDRIKDLIPVSASVASTDFVHPRYTHHFRSYDYSNYARKLSAEDADYIVIDTRHPYSSLRVPEEVPEYRKAPEDWELLPDQTNGYFLVFKRR